MKLGEFLLLRGINCLGLDNTQWHVDFYPQPTSVKELTGFGTNETVDGFVLFIWINDENKGDINVLFTPKFHLIDEETKLHLLVYECND